jgi:peptide/nickel transport system permease protein
MAIMIFSRLVRLLLTMLAVSALTFFLLKQLPGSQIDALLPASAPRDAATIARLEEQFNLNDPVVVQYGKWLGNAVQGDLGTSAFGGLSVSGQIKSRLPVTAELALVSVLFALIIAVPLGIIGAYRPNSKPDGVISGVNQVFISSPNYIVASFLGYFLSVRWGLLDNVGWVRLSTSITGNLKSVFMPALSLALLEIAIYTRLIKTDMSATLQEDFVLSARAKGLPNRFILFRHALRPSSLSLITVLGLNFGALLGGTVVIEQIFALPGIGNKLLQSVFTRDVVMVQGLAVFIAVSYVVINTLIDFVYLAVDPRTRSRAT